LLTFCYQNRLLYAVMIMTNLSNFTQLS